MGFQESAGWLHRLVRSPGWLAWLAFGVVIAYFRLVASFLMWLTGIDGEPPHVYPWGLVGAIAAGLTVGLSRFLWQRRRRAESRG